ncbi:alpha/beta fold hydrolase [Streptomyces sp. NPDC050504]|uniref:alpha/beta fold hydrolase n=1 Tax=Streptomyces sp. NPDC050504 TaxID=3365618 RepID=UPI0037B5777C
MTEIVTHTLDAVGATVRYDVRTAADGADQPPLFLIGSPMDAAGFVTLASHFTDRTVITYDPRACGRSVRDDGASETLPEEHADDLRRVIEALGKGPVDLFASSGGAVNSLALVSRHPELVRVLVAHEPPAAPVLPDSEAALAACADIYETYLRDGLGAGMAKFIALCMHQGQLTDEWVRQPAPDPASFGLPTEDDGSRDDALLGQNMRGCTGYQPDFAALKSASTRIVVAVGEESGEEFPARAGRAVAAGLGRDAVVFPGNHAGFLGGEYGQQGKPDEFAKILREVLSAES